MVERGAVRLDGIAAAAAIRAELAARVVALRRRGIVPGLGVVLVGDDPGSIARVAGRHRDGEEVGIASVRADLLPSAAEEEVLAAVRAMNADPAVTAFIVQLPLPPRVDVDRVLEAIDPAKDADGLHPLHLGRLVVGVDGPIRSPGGP